MNFKFSCCCSLLLASFLLVFSLSSSVHATAKVLPQGVWRISAGSMTTDLEKYAVDTFDVNQQGDAVPRKDFEFVKLRDFTLDRTLAKGFVVSGTIDSDVQIMESYDVNEFTVRIAYGFTDQLTGFFTIPHFQKTRKNTQGLIDAVTTINALAAAGFIPGESDETVNIPPAESTGSGWGDIQLGLKYQLQEDWAVFGFYSGGFLLTGEDYNEIEQDRDGFQEEATGEKGSTYILGVNHDRDMGFALLELTGVIIHTSPTLDRSFSDGHVTEVNPGLMVTIGADMVGAFSEQLFWKAGAKALYAFEDEEKINGSWTGVDNTEAFGGLGTLGLTYRPLPFVEMWTSYDWILFNEAIEGVNQFPGRVYTGPQIRFGLAMYYK